MIGIVDYGMGNVGSVANMLNRLGVKSRIVTKPMEIDQLGKLILPGVGNFGAAMNVLNQSEISTSIINNIQRSDFYLLGICLGMQLLGDFSEEGDSKGLGIIKGQIKKFKDLPAELKIPHMGWNQVEFRKNKIINDELMNFAKFYFVHSYYFEADDKSRILGTTDFGGEFTSAINLNNVYGFQFHPEKSHRYGMTILKSFAEL
jgi:glutamine amidotransferase